MGVEGLWKLIEPSGRLVPLEAMADKVLAIDVSIWLHQAVKGMHDAQGAPVAIAHLLVLFHRLCKLLFYKIRPVFVFDGGVPLLKRQTMAARRTKKTTARTEAAKVRGKLLKNLLKHEALRHVLADEAATAVLGLNSLNWPGPVEEEDLYRLPPVATTHDESSNSSCPSEDEDDDGGEALDIHSVDVTCASFRALPAEIRHDILSDLKETRKQNSWRHVDQMPQQSQDFSDFQMNRLLKRRAVQVSLEECGKEMGARDVSLQELQGMLGEDFRSGSLLTGRVAQEDSTHFMLIQKPKKNPSESAGLIEASKGFDITEHLDDVHWSDQSDEEGAIIEGDGHLRPRELPLSQVLARPSFVDDIQAVLEDGLCQEVSEPKLGETIKEENSGNIVESIKQENKKLKDASSQEAVKFVEEKMNWEEVSEKAENAENSVLDVRKKILEQLKGQLNTKKEEISCNVEDPLVLGDFKEEKLFAEETREEFIQVVNVSSPQKIASARESDFQELPELENLNSSEVPDAHPENPADEKPDAQEKSSSEIQETERSEKVLEGETPCNQKFPQSEGEDEPEEEESNTETSVGEKKIDLPESQLIPPTVSLKPSELSDCESGGNESGLPMILSTEEILKEVSPLHEPAPQTPVSDENTLEQMPEVPAPISLEEQALIHCLEGVNESPLATSMPVDDSSSDDDFLEVRDTPPRYPSPPPSPQTSSTVEENPSPEKPPPIAMSAGEMREMQSELASERDALLSERGKQERLAQNISDQMYKDAQELLALFGVPYVVAPMEAEAQCACLDLLGLTDGTITDDSDIWLFGGRTVYKNFFNQKKHVLEYRADDLKQYYKLGREDMVRLALLVGSDYTTGLAGVGPVTALEVLAAFPCTASEDLLAGLQKFQQWVLGGCSGPPTRAGLKNKLKNTHLTPSFPSSEVVEAYLKPDVDKSKEPFSWRKPNLSLLEAYTKVRFGWSAEKCKQLLMPVLKKLLETSEQPRIDKYFKNIADPSLLEGKLSKRVEGAVKRLGCPAESEDGVIAGPSQPKKARTRTARGPTKAKAAQEKRRPSLDAVTERLHRETKIPQRERDRMLREANKKKAAEMLKAMPAKPPATNHKVNLSESSESD